MLGNKDFAQMISSGSVMSNSNNDGKVRFDLKQVSKWDREINKSVKKKSDSAVVHKPKEKADGAAFGYRDRALERRKDLNTEETKFEEIVSKLDADQTKFIGGDLEHTHFVKGLDYALLEKIRQESANKIKNMDEEQLPSVKVSTIPSKQFDDYLKPDSISVSTPLGESLKKLLFPKVDVVQVAAPALFVTINSGNNRGFSSSSAATKSVNTVSKVGIAPSSSAAQVLARTFYSFELEPSADGDDDKPPVVITKSIKEVERVSDNSSIYSLDPDLMSRFCALFDHGRMISRDQVAAKRKRREKEAALKAAAAAVPKPVQKLATDFDSIYDDIPVGKYVPVGALDDGGGNEVDSSRVSGDEGVKMDVDNKGVFSDVKSSSTTTATMSSKSVVHSYPVMGSAVNKSTVIQASSAAVGSILNSVSTSMSTGDNSNEDLMKPVRDLLAAQANKERAQQARLAAAADMNSTSSSTKAPPAIIVGTDATGKALVHRDVFATTKEKIVKGSLVAGIAGQKAGESFLHGSYEIETRDFEVFSDDGEGDDEEVGPPKKKAHLSAADSFGDKDEDGPPASARGGTTGYNAAVGYEGTIKKSLLKNSVTPWNRSHGASSSENNKGPQTAGRTYTQAKVAPGGMNRAARRQQQTGDK